MAYVDSMGKLKDDFYVDRGYHNKPAMQKTLGPYGGPEYPSDSEYPDPFGTDLFDRVEVPEVNPGYNFLQGLLAGTDQDGITLGQKLAMGDGPALPGEPGRPGTPKAPGGRPHLPGEKPTPKPGGFFPV